MAQAMLRPMHRRIDQQNVKLNISTKVAARVIMNSKSISSNLMRVVLMWNAAVLLILRREMNIVLTTTRGTIRSWARLRRTSVATRPSCPVQPPMGELA